MRANTLFENGAYPKSALEIAQNAEDDNLVVLETAKEQLGLLGVDPDHPTGVVSVFAPVSGTITDQEITDQSAVQSYAAPAPFTISDLSKVWVVCDVWENNMSQVHIGEYADIHLVAYPDRVLKGRIGNILPIVDPNIRTAKVRLEVENPGLMRIGMFVTATFHGLTTEQHAMVPATSILHLHDRRVGLHTDRQRPFPPPGSGGREHASRRPTGSDQRHQARRSVHLERAGISEHG